MDTSSDQGQWAWIVRAPQDLQPSYSEKAARAARAVRPASRPASVRSSAAKLESSSAPRAATSEPTDATWTIVCDCVQMIEIFAFTAVVWEVVLELQIETKADLRSRGQELKARVRALFPGDVERTVKAGRGMLPHARGATDEVVLVPRQELARIYKVIAAAFPIEAIEQLAHGREQPDIAHQARVHYDLLQAFVLRNEQPGRLRTAGQAYAMGKLSIGEVAALLELSERDVVFELERAGYARSVAIIERAASEQGAAVLDEIARRVIANEGRRFPVSAAHVERDVVASQRIEGIDARRWV